jgi:hypothetical protein
MHKTQNNMPKFTYIILHVVSLAITRHCQHFKMLLRESCLFNQSWFTKLHVRLVQRDALTWSSVFSLIMVLVFNEFESLAVVSSSLLS